MSKENMALEAVEAARQQYSSGVNAVNEQLNRGFVHAPIPVLEAVHELLAVPENPPEELEMLNLAYRALKKRLEEPGAIDPLKAPMRPFERLKWVSQRGGPYGMAWANKFAWRLAVPLISKPIEAAEIE